MSLSAPNRLGAGQEPELDAFLVGSVFMVFFFEPLGSVLSPSRKSERMSGGQLGGIQRRAPRPAPEWKRSSEVIGENRQPKAGSEKWQTNQVPTSQFVLCCIRVCASGSQDQTLNGARRAPFFSMVPLGGDENSGEAIARCYGGNCYPVWKSANSKPQRPAGTGQLKPATHWLQAYENQIVSRIKSYWEKHPSREKAADGASAFRRHRCGSH